MKEKTQEVKDTKKSYEINVTVMRNGDITVKGECDYTILGMSLKGNTEVKLNVDDFLNKIIDIAEGLDDTDKMHDSVSHVLHEIGIKSVTIDRLMKIVKEKGL